MYFSQVSWTSEVKEFVGGHKLERGTVGIEFTSSWLQASKSVLLSTRTDGLWNGIPVSRWSKLWIPGPVRNPCVSLSQADIVIKISQKLSLWLRHRDGGEADV